jgi:type VI secretion system protein ImpL
MNRMSRAWAATGSVFTGFLLLGVFTPGWLDLSGSRLWVLRLGLWVLGLAAALLLFLYLRARARSQPPVDDEVDSAFAAARRRLAAAGAGGRISKLPVALVVGLPGSAKTTSIVRSGLEPELLAGEVWRGDEIVSTQALNLWYGSDLVWVEAGGRLLGDEARWRRLVRHLRPARAAAVFSRGAQPPRLAVVCIGCDEFLKPGAAEDVPAAAQRMRGRLTEAAQQLGIRLPVYVVFTKADRLPHFLDFVRSMTNEEAEQVLGATLPVAPALDASEYGEREGSRLHLAFNRLVQALSLRRVETLRRESDEQVRAGAYEFPRELSKVTPLAVRFLLDLCRPSQLGSSPFLRGFYFTGVRPVVVAGATAPTPAHVRSPMGATGVFDARSFVAASQAAPAGGRRVPQWTFLSRIFHRVVAQDQVARDITGGGVRIDMLRRALTGTAVLAMLLLCVGLTVSFVQNRNLIRGAVATLAVVRDVGTTGAEHASIAGDLRRLDSLRATTATLRQWQVSRPPLKLRYGLYTGNRVLPELRGVYFQRLERTLWGRTRTELAVSLDALPDRLPDSVDYDSAYDALRAYLLTTEHPEHSHRHALTHVLVGYWRGMQQPDAATQQLAERQFDFFADELPFGNPYIDPMDGRRVERVREYLGQFGNADQFYRTLLAGAHGAGAAPVDFHLQFPSASAAVRSGVVVPAAFTREGWRHVQASLNDVDSWFERERWVLGDRVVPRGERERLARDIRDRYVADYVAAWSRFLGAAEVLPFNGVSDAAGKLQFLSDRQSPLLQLLAVAARHTGVENDVISHAFQPLHAVLPADVTDRYIVDSNQGYMQGLKTLHLAFAAADRAQGPVRTAALNDAAGAASQVRQQVAGLAQGFSVEGDAQRVGDAVQRLMNAPLGETERLARTGPAQETNAKGEQFCADMRPLLAKYPFSRGARAEATADEIAAFFQPNASRLATFEGQDLAGVVVPQGTGYGQASGSEVQVSRDFLQFLTRTKQVARALYGADGSGPDVPFNLRMHATPQVPSIIASIDGRRHEWTTTVPATRPFAWSAARGNEARIEASLGGSTVTLLQATGTWAVFRLLQQARWREVRPNQYQLTWSFPDRQLELTADLSFDRGIAIFKPDYFNGFTCVARIIN